MARTLFILPLLTLSASAGLIDWKDGKPIDEWAFQIEGRAWFADINGGIEVDDDTVGESDLDFDDNDDLDSSHVTPEGVIRFRHRKIQLRGQYFQQEFDGEDVPRETFRFEDKTYNTFQELDTEVTVRMGGLDIEYLLIDEAFEDDDKDSPWERVGVELGLGIGGRYVYGEGAVSQAGQSSREHSQAFVPVVSASAAITFLNTLSLEFNVAGVHFPVSDVRVSLVEGQVQAKVYLHQHVYIGVGYRYVGLELEDRGTDDDFDIETRIDGFFASVGIQF